MWTEFKKFIMRGNVVDLAVGIIIGTAFGAIVNSLVNDIIMPPVGFVLGSVDFRDLYATLKDGSPAGPYANLEAAKAAGAVTLRYGLFINAIINFLIVALAMFVVIKIMNKLSARLLPPPLPPASITKECPFCKSAIHRMATRCAFCTSEIKAEA
jgi:large conductance mechanosensitive channel